MKAKKFYGLKARIWKVHPQKRIHALRKGKCHHSRRKDKKERASKRKGQYLTKKKRKERGIGVLRWCGRLFSRRSLIPGTRICNCLPRKKGEKEIPQEKQEIARVTTQGAERAVHGQCPSSHGTDASLKTGKTEG